MKSKNISIYNSLKVADNKQNALSHLRSYPHHSPPRPNGWRPLPDRYWLPGAHRVSGSHLPGGGHRRPLAWRALSGRSRLPGRHLLRPVLLLHRLLLGRHLLRLLRHGLGNLGRGHVGAVTGGWGVVHGVGWPEEKQ